MKDAKQKKLTYRLIEPDDPMGTLIHDMIATLVAEHHPDLGEARFAVAWNLASKPDKDGRLTLGKCKRVGPLDRELMEFDFIITLLKEFFDDKEVTDDQRRALLDHELCHGALSLDKNGEPIEDERGRKVYRLRNHDVEEFTEIIRRHGLYKRDLEDFFRAAQKSKQLGLFPREVTTPSKKPGKSKPQSAPPPQVN